KNDKYEDFVSAIKSITFNQKSIQQDRIKVYLHIDGHVSKNMMEFIESSGFIYKSIHSKNPVGLAKGLNKLISILEDEKYVFRMDADDLSLPNRLQYQIEYMENNPIIDISGGSIQEFIASSNNIVATRCYPLTHEEIF
ncbi:glycosyltransferase, partial [Shigella sp. FC1967]